MLGRIRLEALVFESHPENICDQLATGNLESRKIALPEDIRYVLPELKKHFDTHGLPVPQMEQIGSSESDAIEFLREGGVIISAPNCSLEKSNRQIVRTNFLEHCPLYLPICFIRHSSFSSEPMRHVAEFLKSAFAENFSPPCAI